MKNTPSSFSDHPPSPISPTHLQSTSIPITMEEERNESSNGERDDASVEELSHNSISEHNTHDSDRENDCVPDDDPYNNCEPPEKRRKKTPPEEDDKISNMPDSILLHILSFLPTAYVVRTGTLSRRWQYLWTFVPSLDFTFTGSSFDPTKFSTFVDRTLILHKCFKVKRFALNFDYDSSFASRVDVWVRFATRANVEELSLIDLSGKLNVEEHYVLPQHIYTNSSITKLILNTCNVAPIGLIDWRCIKSLTMGRIKLREDALQKIFLGCPVLEFMELNNFIGINRLDVSSASLRKLVIAWYWADYPEKSSELEIIAPNIQSLEMSGSMFINKCRLINVKSLVECSLKFQLIFGNEWDEDDDYEVERNVIRELLHSLRNVEKLTLGGYWIQTLSIMEAKGFPSPQSGRKYLILESCIQKCDLPGIANLLESSPNLETLVIDMSSGCYQFQWDFFEYYDFDGQNYWTSKERSYTCLLLHLKTVKIVGFIERHNKSELMFPLAQFLLKSTRGLEKMVINAAKVSLGKAIDPRDLYQVTQKLLSFPRYSREAVVLFS